MSNTLFSQVLVIGAGNIGLPFLRTMLRADACVAEKVFVVDRNEERRDQVAALAHHWTSLDEVQCSPDLVILSVKPQEAAQILMTCGKKFSPSTGYLSLMAGVRGASISSATQSREVVRSMPNLAVQEALSATVSYAIPNSSESFQTKIHTLLSLVGKNYYVEEESLVDAATALSGSGPGFIFYVIEQFSRAAEQLGFSPELGERLILDTLLGSVRLIEQSPKNAAALRAQVSSKGGTTEAGVRTFDEQGLGRIIVEGIMAARKKSGELGQRLEEEFKNCIHRDT